MHLARGMALQKILRSDDSARRRLLALWQALAAEALRGPAPGRFPRDTHP
jgi:hypothetical protein